jgi:hypothetical protein
MIESNTQYCFSRVYGYRVRPLALGIGWRF